MLNLEIAYPEKFFAKRKSLLWRANYLCPPIIRILNPKRVIDVGSAIGDFVAWFLHNKIDAYGLEGTTQVIPHLVCPQDRMFFADLRKAITPSSNFDLAMCIEVAEHIEEEAAGTFVANLCKLAPRILITVAGPGQSGHHHVNLQEKKYWISKFAEYGYEREMTEESLLASHLTYPHRWVQTIRRNLIYLERQP